MTTYILKRNCLVCKKTFLIDHPRRVLCSKKCLKEQYRIWDKKRAIPHRLQMQKKAWEMKLELIKVLGKKCKTCGNKNPIVLEFSHVDTNKKHPKLKAREKLLQTTKWKLMAEEVRLNRVILECANCHRIRTHNEFWKNDIIK